MDKNRIIWISEKKKLSKSIWLDLNTDRSTIDIYGQSLKNKISQKFAIICSLNVEHNSHNWYTK